MKRVAILASGGGSNAGALMASMVSDHPARTCLVFSNDAAAGVLDRARKEGLWSFETLNPRDFAEDKHHTVDDTPAGGGPGMVMRADILA